MIVLLGLGTKEVSAHGGIEDHSMPSYLYEETEYYIPIPPANYDYRYNYPLMMVPKWFGAQEEGDTTVLNGSYTINTYSEVSYNLDTKNPLHYSMRVHKNGDVSFNGPLFINTKDDILVFNNQVVGLLVYGHIVWIHDLHYLRGD